MASIAGLPVSRAMVLVPPPLSCSGPRVDARDAFDGIAPQDASLLRLWLPSVRLPAQFVPLPARRVLATETVPPLLAMPPAALEEVLFAIVTAFSVKVPGLQLSMPPAPASPAPLLPAIVLLVMVALAPGT